MLQFISPCFAEKCIIPPGQHFVTIQIFWWHGIRLSVEWEGKQKDFFLLYCTVPNFIGSTTALICPWRASNVWVHWVSEAQKHFLFLARTASIVVGTEVTQSAAPCCEPPQRRRWGCTWSADFWVSKQRRRWRWTLSSLWWDDRGLEAQGGLDCNAANSDRLFTAAKVVVWDTLSLCVSVCVCGGFANVQKS